MKINPRTFCNRIVCRLRCLQETSDDTHRHACSETIQNGLVECETNSFGDRNQDLCREINVSIFECRVADRIETCNHEAAEFCVVECEVKLVDVLAAFCPHCFLNGSFNRLTCVSANRTNENVLIQFGIFDEVLTNKTKEFCRNQNASICDGSLFLDGCANLMQVVLHSITLDEVVDLNFGHRPENFVSCTHCSTSNSCAFICGWFSRCWCRCRFFRFSFLLSFFCFDVVFEASDLVFQFLLGCIICILVTVELLDCLFNGCLLFFCRFCRFSDSLFEFLFSFLQIFTLCEQRLQFLVLFVELGTKP